MEKIIVKIVVGNIYSKIIGFLPDHIHAKIDHSLSYKVPNSMHIPSVKKRQWDGIIRLYYKSKGQSFYTGLLAFVRDILKENNVEYTIIDNRFVPPKNLPRLMFIPPSHYEARDYQNFTINRAVKFTRGVLEMATGSGKTLVVARLISELKVAPFIFIVLTKDLMQQAYDVMSTCLNEEIGKIGDGVCDIKNINVMTVQTAVMALNGKNIKINDYQFDDEDEWDEKGIESVEKAESIKQLLKDAKGIYFDETHHASAKTARDVITGATSAYYRYGGSATTKREDNADILIQAMFGSKIVSINASYLIKKGYLVKPYIFFDPINSKIDFHSYQKVYKHCVVENQDFHLHVAKTAEHLVSKGLTVLVLVKQYAHGDYLKSMIKYSEFITGKMSLKQRTEEIDKLRKGERRVMISTSLSDEGLDLPDLSAVLLCGLGKSVSRTMQRIGRVLRTHKNKSKAIVVVYDHNARFLKKHSDKIRKILKKESEFILMNSNGGDYILDEIDKVLGIKVENTLF